MTLVSITMTGAALPGAASDTPPWPVRVTRSLLGYGVIAGPFYVVVSLAQAHPGAASTSPGTRGACWPTARWAGSRSPTSP